MGHLKHKGEGKITLLITAELAFVWSRLGYKDMSELKIERNESVVLSLTHTHELEQQGYLSASQWHIGAPLP